MTISRARVLSACLLATLSFVSAPVVADPPDPFAGLTPAAGDSHRHAFSPWYATGLLGGEIYHERGMPYGVYDALRLGGFDWGSVSLHDVVMETSSTAGGFLCWTNPQTSGCWPPPPPPDPPPASTFGLPVAPDSNGYRDYLTPSGYVSPPYNWALSASTAADAIDAQYPSYVAFSGREYTPSYGQAVGPLKGEGGHKIVILAGPTASICGEASPATGCVRSEYQLYQWMVGSPGGVILQAHPGSTWLPLHPVNAPGGVSDSFVVGTEIGSAANAKFEESFRVALAEGFRVFPAYGSDRHNYFGQPLPTGPQYFLDEGATICWTAALTRPAVLDAMRARRCFYSRAFRRELRFEMGDDASASVPMGSILTVGDGRAWIKVNVARDARFETPASVPFARLEIRQVSAAGDVLLQACTASNRVTDCECTGSDGSCTFRGEVDVSAGAVFALACSGDPCVRGFGSPGAPEYEPTNYLAESAPIFVNWDAFKGSTGNQYCDFTASTIPCGVADCLDPAVDADRDGYPDTCDNCPAFNPSQLDTDMDGLADACDSDDDGDGLPDVSDNCPVVANPTQADFDGDLDGDVCDNCPTITNSDQSDTDADQTGQACDTCTSTFNRTFLGPNRVLVSNQLDDDADGRGNLCDFDFDNLGAFITSSDYNDMKASVGKSVYGDPVCGVSGSQPCAKFDVDGNGSFITSNDHNLTKAAVGKAISTYFPKCAACSPPFSRLLSDPLGATLGKPICVSSGTAPACPY